MVNDRVHAVKNAYRLTSFLLSSINVCHYYRAL